MASNPRIFWKFKPRVHKKHKHILQTKVKVNYTNSSDNKNFHSNIDRHIIPQLNSLNPPFRQPAAVDWNSRRCRDSNKRPIKTAIIRLLVQTSTNVRSRVVQTPVRLPRSRLAHALSPRHKTLTGHTTPKSAARLSYNTTHYIKQDAQLSQRGRALLQCFVSFNISLSYSRSVSHWKLHHSIYCIRVPTGVPY